MRTTRVFWLLVALYPTILIYIWYVIWSQDSSQERVWNSEMALIKKILQFAKKNFGKLFKFS